MAKSGLALTLGGIEVGILVNACVFGISMIQLVNYYHARFNDSWRIRALVWWTIIIDIAHTMIITEMLWRLTIDGFGDFDLLALAPWEYDCTPYFVIAAAIPIQLFLGWRVKNLIQGQLGWLAFGVIAACSTAAGVCGFYMSTNLLLFVRTQAGYTPYIQVANAWTGLSTATDILITGSLTFLLLRRRTGFRRTDSMILQIITVSVESAIPVSIFSLGHVIAVARGPQTGIHEMFLIPLGRLYTNTLLTTLNSRASIHRDIASSGDHQSFNLSGRPTIHNHNRDNLKRLNEVRIDVDVETQHQMDDISVTKPGSDRDNKWDGL